MIKTARLDGCSFLPIFSKFDEQHEEPNRKYNTPLNRFAGQNNFHSYFCTLYAHAFWKKLSSANSSLRVKATLTYMPSIHVDLLNEKAQRIVIALLNLVLNCWRRKSYIGSELKSRRCTINLVWFWISCHSTYLKINSFYFSTRFSISLIIQLFGEYSWATFLFDSFLWSGINTNLN